MRNRALCRRRFEMTTLLTKAVMGATLAATALTVAAPAEAQYYRGRHYHRGGDATGAAIVGGIAGAAIASSNNRDRYYRDDYYYNQPRYNYYNEYPQYNYRECRIERRYDPYYGRSVRVRVCY